MARKRSRSKAWAERERLEGEIKTARHSRGEANRRQIEAGHRLKRLDAERQALLHDAARGAKGAEEALARNAEQRAEAQREGAEWRERERAAREAVYGAERALRAHLCKHLDEFIADATKLTEAAMAEREKVAAAIEQARASEQQARQEWGTLAGAVRLHAKVGLGPIPDSPLDQVAALLAKAPPPEPRDVARSRRRRLGIPNLPKAVRDLFKGPEPKGDWTPIPADAGVEVVE